MKINRGYILFYVLYVLYNGMQTILKRSKVKSNDFRISDTEIMTTIDITYMVSFWKLVL